MRLFGFPGCRNMVELRRVLNSAPPGPAPTTTLRAAVVNPPVGGLVRFMPCSTVGARTKRASLSLNPKSGDSHRAFMTLVAWSFSDKHGGAR